MIRELIKPILTKIGKFKSKDEEMYFYHLRALKENGVVKDFGYEWLTFKLADGTRYTPDFIVIWHDCVECIEIKGFMREAAAVRFKVAAEKFPYFKWLMLRRDKKYNSWLKIMEY